jgi:hypothetical protein
VPSEAQFRIAYSLLKEFPLAATGRMYQKSCLEARAAADENVPSWRCSNPIFGRISHAIGQAVAYELHRQLAKNSKNPPQWACLAEDNGGGIAQKCVRVAFKNFDALDVLLDWSHHGGQKKAQSLCTNGKDMAPSLRVRSNKKIIHDSTRLIWPAVVHCVTVCGAWLVHVSLCMK